MFVCAPGGQVARRMIASSTCSLYEGSAVCKMSLAKLGVALTTTEANARGLGVAMG